jgi:hypothetical protein
MHWSASINSIINMKTDAQSGEREAVGCNCSATRSCAEPTWKRINIPLLVAPSACMRSLPSTLPIVFCTLPMAPSAAPSACCWRLAASSVAVPAVVCKAVLKEKNKTCPYCDLWALKKIYSMQWTVSRLTGVLSVALALHSVVANSVANVGLDGAHHLIDVSVDLGRHAVKCEARVFNRRTFGQLTTRWICTAGAANGVANAIKVQRMLANSCCITAVSTDDESRAAHFTEMIACKEMWNCTSCNTARALTLGCWRWLKSLLVVGVERSEAIIAESKGRTQISMNSYQQTVSFTAKKIWISTQGRRLAPSQGFVSILFSLLGPHQHSRFKRLKNPLISLNWARWSTRRRCVTTWAMVHAPSSGT